MPKQVDISIIHGRECVKWTTGAAETSAFTHPTTQPAAHPTGLETPLTRKREPKNSHDKISFCYHNDGSHFYEEQTREHAQALRVCSF
jgi:hypothetical protein